MSIVKSERTGKRESRLISEEKKGETKKKKKKEKNRKKERARSAYTEVERKGRSENQCPFGEIRK